MKRRPHLKTRVIMAWHYICHPSHFLFALWFWGNGGCENPYDKIFEKKGNLNGKKEK